MNRCLKSVDWWASWTATNAISEQAHLLVQGDQFVSCLAASLVIAQQGLPLLG
jgi:hypothetical protein